MRHQVFLGIIFFLILVLVPAMAQNQLDPVIEGGEQVQQEQVIQPEPVQQIQQDTVPEEPQQNLESPCVTSPTPKPWETRAGLEEAARNYYQKPAVNYYTNRYTQVVREDISEEKAAEIIERAKRGEPIPVKYAPLIEAAKNDGTWVGEPNQDGSELVEGWRVSVALQRMREKQNQIDGIQDKKITEAQNTANAGLLRAFEAKKTAVEATQLAGMAWSESQVNKWWGGKCTMAIAVFLSGLALTLLFLALRWFIPAAVVGGLTFLGLLVMAIMSGSGWFIGAVCLIGVASAAAIMWYVYPLLAGQPAALPNQPAAQQAPVTRAAPMI